MKKYNEHYDAHLPKVVMKDMIAYCIECVQRKIYLYNVHKVWVNNYIYGDLTVYHKFACNFLTNQI